VERCAGLANESFQDKVDASMIGKDSLFKERIIIGRLIEAMTGGTAQVESVHGAGSPQAQRIMIFREGMVNIEPGFVFQSRKLQLSMTDLGNWMVSFPYDGGPRR
jgi:aromatic ring hydroxylase